MDGPPPPQPPPVTSPSPRGTLLVILCFVFLFVPTLAVGLRLYCRRLKRTGLAQDDVWIVVALVFLFGNGLSEIVAVFLAGRGTHVKELPISQLEQNLQLLLAAELFWAASTSATKVSLLFLYKRVFPQRSFRYLTYGLLGLVGAYWLGATLYFLLKCQPFSAAWDITIHDACGDQHAGWLGTGVVNIATDAVVLAAPMYNVWSLQLPARTKTAVAGVFGMGFIVLAISILRLNYILTIDLTDFTYTSIAADILSLLEPALMITCACLPIMRPLFQKILPSSFSRSGRRSRRATASGGSHLRSGGAGGHLAVQSIGGGSAVRGGGARGPGGFRSSLAGAPDGFQRLSDAETGASTPSDEGTKEYPLSELRQPEPRRARGAAAGDAPFAGAGRGAKNPMVDTVISSHEGDEIVDGGIQVRTDWTVSSVRGD